MNATILDDYFDTLPMLNRFKKLDGDGLPAALHGTPFPLCRLFNAPFFSRFTS